MQDESGEAVRMMTIHIAKGLEFDVVFITGLEQDLFWGRNYCFCWWNINMGRR